MSGRSIPRCDACGEFCLSPDSYETDDEVCKGSDGPGFFLCGRDKCSRKLEGLDANARRKHYAGQRAFNEALAAMLRGTNERKLAGIRELREAVEWANSIPEFEHDNMTAEQILARFRKEHGR